MSERILLNWHDHKAASIRHFIRHHHERWDGKGYPDGLRSEEIPLIARVIAIADCYDAMTTDRPYRRGLDHTLAIAEIENCAGSQFDPNLAYKFIEIFSV